MKLYCRICQTALTNELLLLTDYNLLKAGEEESFVPKGYYLVSDGQFYTGTAGNFLVSLDDMMNVQHHTNKARLNGCCGLDGCDGPNTVCINGHEVGTERSDCWMPWCFTFEKEAVELK